MSKTLVLGLGNTIRGDDAVGIHLVRRLKQILPSSYRVKELNTAGLDMMEVIKGYARVVLIDAIRTSRGKSGQVYRLSPRDFGYSSSLSSMHSVNIRQVMELGRKLLADKMPKKIEVLAVEASELDEFREGLSPELDKRFDEILGTIRAEIESSGKS